MKKLFTLIVMLVAVLSASAATPSKLYIVGQPNVGIGSAGWTYTPASSGCVEMTKNGDKFTASVTLTGTAWFCFGEQDGSSWDDFNNNYSWRPSSNNFVPKEGTAVSMIHHSNYSFQLGAGEYTFTVDFSGSAPTFTLSGKQEEVKITGYSVIGEAAIFGGDDWAVDFDLTNTAGDIWTGTLSSVTLAAGSYEYKARANHDWGIANYPAEGNNTLTVDADGTYDVTFTLDVAAGSLDAQLTTLGGNVGPDALYLFGDAPFGGWEYNPIAGGTAVAMTKNGNSFTWSGTIDAKAYFGLITQDGTDWGDLNNNYRFGPATNGDTPTIGTAMALSRCDNAVQLPSGDYTFTVTFTDDDNATLTVTGTKTDEPVTITSYTVLGDKALFGGDGWDTNGNEMTKESESIYTYKLTGVELTAREYEYKVTANHTWGVFEIPTSGNQVLNITEDGTYDITFTLDLDANTLAADAVKQGAEPNYAPDQLYILGTIANGWVPNAGAAMTKNGNTFTYSCTVTGTAQTFSFTSKLSSSADNWDEIASSRYGAEADQTVVEVGTTYNVVYGNNDNAFSLDAGEYTLTVTFTATGATLVVTGEKKQDDTFVLPDFATYVEGHAFAYFEKPASWTNTINVWAWGGFGNVYTGFPGENTDIQYVGTRTPQAAPGASLAASSVEVYRWTDPVAGREITGIIFTEDDGTTDPANRVEIPDGTFTNGGYYGADGSLKATVTVSTGINNINTEATQAGKIYNLQGVQVQNMSQKGLYIVNGKKVLVK